MDKLAEIARKHLIAWLESILHGDDKHRQWLLEEGEKMLNCCVAAMTEALAAQEREVTLDDGEVVLASSVSKKIRELTAQLSQAEADLEHAERNEEEQALTIQILTGRLSQAQADKMRWVDEATKARDALAEAIELVKFYHGPDAWDIYYEHSPEMKRLRAAAASPPRTEEQSK